MKHFTTHFLACLLSALMSGGTAKAQEAQEWNYYMTDGTEHVTKTDLTSGYYILSVQGIYDEGLLYWSDEQQANSNLLISSTKYTEKVNKILDKTSTSEDVAFIFYLDVNAEQNTFTIKSVKSGKFLSYTGVSDAAAANVVVPTVDNDDTSIASYTINYTHNNQEPGPIVIPENTGKKHFIVKLANTTYNESTSAFLHVNGTTDRTTSPHPMFADWHLEHRTGFRTDIDNTPTSSSMYTCAKIAFFKLSEAAAFTYDYKMYGNSVKKETVAGIIDSEFPSITLPSYCTGSKPEGTVTAADEGTTKDIDVSWNGPFTFTETTDNAYWYQMKGAAAQAVVRNAGDNTDIPLKNEGLTTEERTFTYSTKEHWAFVGDPFNGFKIYNRYQQDNTYGRLVASTTMSGSNGGGTIARVSYTTPLADGMTELWSIYNPTDLSTTITIDNGFFIGEHGHPTYIMNSRGNKMSFWTAGKGDGSAFTVRQNELPPINLTKIEGKTYGTFYIDYPILMPEGVEVYTGTADVENGKVLMNNATDRVIPAKTGVVLVGTIPDGTAEEATAVTYPMSISNSAGDVEKGIITGTLETLEMGGTNEFYLVFGRSSTTNKLGFYKPSSSLSSIPAHKAFINSTIFTSTGTNVQGLALSFDGGTETGITFNQLLAPEAQGAETVYDLSGRRVSTPAKGCYIRNGKKVYIK